MIRMNVMATFVHRLATSRRAPESGVRAFRHHTRWILATYTSSTTLNLLIKFLPIASPHPPPPPPPPQIM